MSLMNLFLLILILIIQYIFFQVVSLFLLLLNIYSEKEQFQLKIFYEIVYDINFIEYFYGVYVCMSDLELQMKDLFFFLVKYCFNFEEKKMKRKERKKVILIIKCFY